MQERAPGRVAALALMVLIPLLWSSAGVVTRQIERAEPFEQVFWRSLFAFLFVCAWLRRNPLGAARQAGAAGLFSGVMWTLMFTAFVIALSLTTTANALVMMSISPFLAALLSVLILKEHVATRTWIAAGAAAIGIGWMFHSSLGGGAHLTGMLVALLIPVASAANLIALRASRAKVDLVPAVMIGGALSCLVALPFALPFAASGRDLLLLGLLGVFQLGLPCTLLVVVSRTLRAPEIALLGLLEVVLGPLWAWLGAGETPAAATLYGGGIVLAALVVNELGSLRPKMGR